MNFRVRAIVVWILCVSPALGQSKAPSAKLPNWGQVVSPNRKVQFKTSEDSLELTLPSEANDFSIELGRITAPRVLQPVSGDFTIQVKVSQVTAPGNQSTTPGRRPFCSAGLLIWQDAGNYIRLEHARCLVAPLVMNYANWELRSQGQWVRQGRFSLTVCMIMEQPRPQRADRAPGPGRGR